MSEETNRSSCPAGPFLLAGILMGVVFYFIVGGFVGLKFPSTRIGFDFIQIRNATAFCLNQGGFSHIDTPVGSKTEDDIEVRCLNGVLVQYKYIKDLPKK